LRMSILVLMLETWITMLEWHTWTLVSTMKQLII
jgi:hypothetical protein